MADPLAAGVRAALGGRDEAADVAVRPGVVAVTLTLTEHVPLAGGVPPVSGASAVAPPDRCPGGRTWHNVLLAEGTAATCNPARQVVA